MQRGGRIDAAVVVDEIEEPGRVRGDLNDGRRAALLVVGTAVAHDHDLGKSAAGQLLRGLRVDLMVENGKHPRALPIDFKANSGQNRRNAPLIVQRRACGGRARGREIFAERRDDRPRRNRRDDRRLRRQRDAVGEEAYVPQSRGRCQRNSRVRLRGAEIEEIRSGRRVVDDDALRVARLARSLVVNAPLHVLENAGGIHEHVGAGAYGRPFVLHEEIRVSRSAAGRNREGSRAWRDIDAVKGLARRFPREIGQLRVGAERGGRGKGRLQRCALVRAETFDADRPAADRRRRDRKGRVFAFASGEFHGTVGSQQDKHHALLPAAQSGLEDRRVRRDVHGGAPGGKCLALYGHRLPGRQIGLRENLEAVDRLPAVAVGHVDFGSPLREGRRPAHHAGKRVHRHPFGTGVQRVAHVIAVRVGGFDVVNIILAEADQPEGRAA